MMNTKQKTAFCLNLLIFVSVAFSTTAMLTGFNFMGGSGVLSASNWLAFRYFTVDSNVLAGLVSLFYIIYMLTPAGKKSERLPKAMYILKLAATTGVTLTMMVTVFFLAPRSATTYWDLFMNSNLFMHLLTPLFCIITFVFFEAADKPSFALSPAGVIPMVLYASFYIPNIFLHLENGKTSYNYDWYGFLFAGVNTVWIVVPLILLLTWVFAICLWGFNRLCNSKR